MKSWRDILHLAKELGLKNLARRLQLNNDCWGSSGEFGRDQVAICDAIRLQPTRKEMIAIMKQIDEESKEYMVW